MKVLENTILSLGKEEYIQLSSFIKSKPSKRKRKDLLLLELIRTEEVENENVILNILEIDAKSNAYHALRKRLLKLVMHFIYLKKEESDSSVKAEVKHLMAFSDFWLDKNAELYLKFLNRANKLATENDLYSLQEVIQKRLLKAGVLSQREIQNLAEGYSENQLRKEEKDKAELALNYLSIQIRETQKQSRSMPYKLMADHALRKFNLEDSVIQNPKMVYQTVECVRVTLEGDKDYLEFEKYLEAIHNDYFSFVNFSDNDHYYYLKILYTTAYTYYYNRKFERGLEYAQKLGLALKKYDDDCFKNELGKYILVKGGLQFYSGKIGEAIATLDTFDNDDSVQLEPKEQNYLLLNLAYYNYCNGNFEKALGYIESLKHTDSWYEKRIGEHWPIKKAVVEMVILFDLDQKDEALAKINSIVENHHQALSKKEYSSIGAFLKMARKLIVDPDGSLGSDQHIKEQLLGNYFEQGDLQTLVYYAWLKSKNNRISFYQTLLQTTARNIFSFA